MGSGGTCATLDNVLVELVSVTTVFACSVGTEGASEGTCGV